MNVIPKHSPDDDLPPLPAVTIMKDGQIVETGGDIWRLRASSDGGKLMKIEWSRLRRDVAPLRLSGGSVHLFKLYLVRRMQFSKAGTIRNDFDMLRRFLRWFAKTESQELSFNWRLVTYAMLCRFLAHGMSTALKGLDFVRFRTFYLWGASVIQNPEFDRRLAEALKKIHTQSPVSGVAVRFRDILKGPFSPAEQKLIREAIRLNAGTREDRACVMIHEELGPNPNAVARIRTHELQKYEVNIVKFGESRLMLRYQVDLPRVKKGTEQREVVPRPISNKLGLLLEQLKSEDPEAPLFHWLNPDFPEKGIRLAMHRFSRAANLISPRTGKRLNVHPRRFRSGLATEMQRDGASLVKIAKTLDHSDLQSVKVYVEAGPYIVDQLGKELRDVFDPILPYFIGKVVDSTSEPAFPGVPPKIIPSTSLHLPILQANVGGIGMCGRDVRKDGLCQLAPPLTCYPCEFFAAFRNGPHEEILQSLCALLEDMKNSSDPRISNQLAEVIEAIKQLVAQIRSEGKPRKSEADS